MTRVLSALALLPVVVAIIWFLPPVWTLVLAEAVLLLALIEYADLMERMGAPFARVTTVVAALVTCAAVTLVPSMALVVLTAATVGIGVIQLADRERAVLPSVSAATFSLLYLAVPLGLLAALRAREGRGVVLLLLLTVMASDTAQYYGGRRFGRRALAPAVSPKKTVAGAVFGLVAGTVAMVAVGQWWLPAVHPVVRALLGATVAGLGIAGDLFESSLKRSAKVKDASALIPGHGGVLDRLDGILFAAPVYYAVVQLAR
jgi:phosphatidate cytidylyltransferase